MAGFIDYDKYSDVFDTEKLKDLISDFTHGYSFYVAISNLMYGATRDLGYDEVENECIGGSDRDCEEIRELFYEVENIIEHIISRFDLMDSETILERIIDSIKDEVKLEAVF